MSDRLTEAVRKVLDSVPGSDREVAQEAGLSPSLLSMIRKRKRSASRETAEKIKEALRRWTHRCGLARNRLSSALDMEASEEAP